MFLFLAVAVIAIFNQLFNIIYLAYAFPFVHKYNVTFKFLFIRFKVINDQSQPGYFDTHVNR